MRVRYNNSHGERERREREREGNPKMEMIIGYGRTILSLLSLSFSLGSFLPAQNQKNKFSSSRDSLLHKKLWGEGLSHLLLLFVFFWEERTLAPAANALVFACMAKADIF